MGENPIVQLRRRLSIGQAEFGRILGVSLAAVWAAENGVAAKPVAIFRALSLVGYDTQALSEAYRRWYGELVEDRRRRLKSRIHSAYPTPEGGIVQAG
ncbi:MAG: hypothetical protein ABI401_04600 [Candidatus Dormibacter sp.]